LLALGRRLRSYLKTEELDALMTWLVEAIRKGQHPANYIRRAVTDALRSRNAATERDENHVQELLDGGAVQLAHDGEEQTFAVWGTSTDPLLQKRLTAALSELSAKQRKAFLLSEVDELTDPEIAERMALAPKTIRNLLSEARKILRDTLGDVSAFR